MKFSCTQENLNRALNRVSKTTKKDANLPVLGNILFEVKENKLKLSATDLEIGVEGFVFGKAEKEGTITIPSDLITSYISSLPNSNVVLELSKKTLNVKCGSFKGSIRGIDASEFPIIPKVKREISLKINSTDLVHAFSQVILASAVDESRPEICGVFFNLEKNNLTLAATDSYRLAEKKIKLGKRVKIESRSVIIPTKTIQELIRVAQDTVSDVEISLSDSQVVFSFDGFILSSRLVEGKYPDYGAIIPSSSKTEVLLKKEDFLNIIKVVSLFSKGSASDILFNIDAKKKKMLISAQTAQVGENESRIKLDKIKGKNNKISFNYRYVLDGLSVIDNDEILFGITSEAAPGIFRGTEDDSYVYIIMPIQK